MATSSSPEEDTSNTWRIQRTQSHGSAPDADVFHVPLGDGQATTREESQALESSASYSSEKHLLTGHTVQSVPKPLTPGVDHNPQEDFPLQKEEFDSNSMIVPGSLTGGEQDSVCPENAVRTRSELEAHVLTSCQTCTEDRDAGFTGGCELSRTETGSLPFSSVTWEADVTIESSQANETDPDFILPPILVPQDTLSSVDDTARNVPLGEEESNLTEDYHGFVGIAEQWLPRNTVENVFPDAFESVPPDTAESLLSDKTVHSLDNVVNSCEGVNEHSYLEGQQSIANTHLCGSLPSCLKLLPFYQLLMKGISGGGRKSIYWQLLLVLPLLTMKIFFLWDTFAPVLCQRPLCNVSGINMSSMFQSLTSFAGAHHGPVPYGYITENDYRNSRLINLMEIATPTLQEPTTIALQGNTQSYDQGVTGCDFLLDKYGTGKVQFCNSHAFDIKRDHRIRCLLPLPSKKPDIQTFTTLSGVPEGAKAAQGQPAGAWLRSTAKPPPPQPVSTLESYFPRLSEPNLDATADAQEAVLVSEHQIKKEATHAFDRPKFTALPKDPFYQR